MADIELVIKIPEEIRLALINNIPLSIDQQSICDSYIKQAIINGTPLPKGHGRLGDLDKLIKTMKERNDDNGGEPLNAVDRGYDLAYQHIVEEAKGCIIIEADKAEGERTNES